MADTISYQAHFHGQDAHAPGICNHHFGTVIELAFLRS